MSRSVLAVQASSVDSVPRGVVDIPQTSPPTFGSRPISCLTVSPPRSRRRDLLEAGPRRKRRTSPSSAGGLGDTERDVDPYLPPPPVPPRDGRYRVAGSNKSTTIGRHR